MLTICDHRLGQLDHLAVPLIVLGQIHQCHGRPDLAFASYREALALGEEAGDPQLVFNCYDGLTTLFLDIGGDALAGSTWPRRSRSASGLGWSPTRWLCCRSSDNASRRPTA